MSSTLVFVLVLLSVCLLPDALPASGNSWDWLGGVGFVAFAFLLSLSWESESPARAPRVHVHRNLALSALVLTTVHAIGYLIIDPVSVEYLKPTAPVYMLMGIVALVLLLALTLGSLPALRRRFYASFPRFRLWHLGLSVALVITSSWHVLGTSHVINNPLKTSLLAVAAFGFPSLAYALRRQGLRTAFSAPPVSQSAADRGVVLITLISLLLTCLYTAIRNP